VTEEGQAMERTTEVQLMLFAAAGTGDVDNKLVHQPKND